MKSNRKLLLIKAYYFLTHGGCAPIAPFLPIIGRQMGFSSLFTGFIFAGVPIASVIAKFLIGNANRLYHCQKISFLALILVQTVSYFGVQYVPPLPTVRDSVTEVKCSNETFINICSGNILTDKYIDNFTTTYINRNLYCMITLQKKDFLVQQIIKNITLNTDEDNYDIKEDTEIHNASYAFKYRSYWEPGYYPIKVSIAANSFHYEDNCITMKINWFATHELKWLNPKCNIETTSVCNFHCGEIFYEFIHKPPVMSDKKVYNFHQFWLFLTVVVIGNSAFQINNSIGNSMCLNFLGEDWEQFANVRLWGSLGTGVISVISGFLIDKLSEGSTVKDMSIAFYISLGVYLTDFLVCFKLKMKKKDSQTALTTLSSNIDARNVPAIVFVLWCALVGFYTTISDNFLFWYLEDIAAANESDLSLMKTIEGLILVIRTHLGDFPAFFCFGWLLKNIGRMHLMTFVLFAFGVSFILYSYITNLWLSLPIAILDGLSFGLHSAIITLFGNAARRTGSDTNVENTLYGYFNSLGISIGGVIGGYLMQTYSGSLVFWIFGRNAEAK
ncbi:major facilitator superfamily domain-containing protein 6-B-like isoform X2 [Cimex lectularius]|uniref:Major facilitator superfamily associated domain-containing protein n=1 Tax=Cimex lectularius TaxID=79782 RepID=A0A8I6TME2_CIMLE|nr:major facilitator superfamily domain-containing protein 6-B-like isoform X2 [Cimex lectularius]